MTLILFGGMMSCFLSERGMMYINEGETSNTVIDNRTQDRKTLDFSIRLKDFLVEYYAGKIAYYNDQKKVTDYFDAVVGEEYTSPFGVAIKIDEIASYHIESNPPGEIYCADRQVGTKISAEEGKSLSVGDYTVRIEKVIPDFVMDITTKTATSRSDEFNNPAALVLIDGNKKSFSKWIFAKHKSFHKSEEDIPLNIEYIIDNRAVIDHKNFDNNMSAIKVTVSKDNKESYSKWLLAGSSKAERVLKEKDFILEYVKGNKPKTFRSSIDILSNTGEILAEGVVEVNSPFKHKKYSIYQSTYDMDNEAWSGLEIIYDPGVTIVYVGFIGFILGLGLIAKKRFISND